MKAKTIGSGWHKQSLRHSNARRLGKAGGMYHGKIYVSDWKTGKLIETQTGGTLYALSSKARKSEIYPYYVKVSDTQQTHRDLTKETLRDVGDSKTIMINGEKIDLVKRDDYSAGRFKGAFIQAYRRGYPYSAGETEKEAIEGVKLNMRIEKHYSKKDLWRKNTWLIPADKLERIHAKLEMEGKPTTRKNINKAYEEHLKAHEFIKGGLGDNKPDTQFNKKSLREGMKVEKEHTNNPLIAKEIAKDHLTEDPKYYKKLKKIKL